MPLSFPKSAMVTAGIVIAMAGCVLRDKPAAAEGRQPPARESQSQGEPKKMTGTGRAYVKPPKAEIEKRLSPMEYEVTQNAGTEPPFRNRFWNNHEDGLYVDVVSGEPLFSSRDKFESGTGWPSFTAPVENGRVVDVVDSTHGMRRVEVRSKAGDSHLGHVFEDGPEPSGLRYCINSASLRFIPKDKLVTEGYGEYAPLFGLAAPPKPAATDNACVTPPAGQAPGCETTLETAVLAGGCFWGMEEILRSVPGVLETEVGYTGGKTESPGYDTVRQGTTGHAESIRITFDPKKITFADLLETWFFRMHDPTTRNRQGNDVGTQYRSAIFATSDAQKKTAAEVIAKVDKSGKWKGPIVTEVVTASTFTPAEGYHQDYLQNHPGGYTCHFLR